MKATTVKEVLLEARRLVERGWCQRCYARDAEGKSIDETSPQAVSFCLSGAFFATDTTSWDLCRSVRAMMQDELGISLVAFNDKEGRTKQEVLDLLDRAIERAI